ncbi:hypothetical protein ES707_20708 [subsurface metagenome]
MHDAKLEAEIGTLGSYIAAMKVFHDIVMNAVETEVVSPEKINEFTELRSSIPSFAGAFYDEIGLDDELHVDEVLGQIEDLSEAPRLTAIKKRAFIAQWHRVYVELCYLMGRLKLRREKIEALNPAKLRFRQVVRSPLFITLAGIAVALALIVLIVLLF